MYHSYRRNNLNFTKWIWRIFHLETLLLYTNFIYFLKCIGKWLLQYIFFKNNSSSSYKNHCFIGIIKTNIETTRDIELMKIEMYSSFPIVGYQITHLNMKHPVLFNKYLSLYAVMHLGRGHNISITWLLEIKVGI